MWRLTQTTRQQSVRKQHAESRVRAAATSSFTVISGDTNNAASISEKATHRITSRHAVAQKALKTRATVKWEVSQTTRQQLRKRTQSGLMVAPATSSFSGASFKTRQKEKPSSSNGSCHNQLHSGTLSDKATHRITSAGASNLRFHSWVFRHAIAQKALKTHETVIIGWKLTQTTRQTVRSEKETHKIIFAP